MCFICLRCTRLRLGTIFLKQVLFAWRLLHCLVLQLLELKHLEELALILSAALQRLQSLCISMPPLA